MEAIAVEHVTKRFDTVVAVSDLSLHIEQGAVFGLLGPNGAGKTTTLRMVMNILAPDEGTVQVFGQPASARTQDLTGYLPEERGLYTRMKVREVLVFLAALKGLSEEEASMRVHEWLERLGLAAWSEKKINDLSKGMQQKAQFIAAVDSSAAALDSGRTLYRPRPGQCHADQRHYAGPPRKGRHHHSFHSPHGTGGNDVRCHLPDQPRAQRAGGRFARHQEVVRQEHACASSTPATTIFLTGRIWWRSSTTSARWWRPSCGRARTPRKFSRLPSARGVRLTRFELVEPPLARHLHRKSLGGACVKSGW